MSKHEVVTPIPGVFYRSPDPESDPFAVEGDKVDAGATVGLVELMKNFQAVETEAGGTVVEFLVDNEAEVTAGQPVAIVDDEA